MSHPLAPPFPGPPPEWAAVLEAGTDLLALVDERGTVLWTNAGFLRASGHTAQAAAGRPLDTLLAPPEGWPGFSSLITEPPPAEPLPLPWRDAAGQPRHALLTVQCLRPGQAPGTAHALVRLQDTTELERLRAEASRQAELLDMTQEIGRLAVFERDLPAGTGRWDPHMFRFFGMDPREGTPRFGTILDRIDPADGLDQAWLTSTRQAGRYDHHYRIFLPDGSVRRVHSHWEVKNSPDGVPYRAIGMLVDDTAVYQLAEAYDKTHAQLDIAVELGNIAVWRHDIALDRFFYNERGYRILGIAPRADGITKDEVRDKVHPDDLARVVASVEQSLQTDDPVDLEARYRRSDGTWAYILTRRVVRRNEKGEPIEFIGVGLDISAQVEKLRQASELAEHLQIAVNAAGVGVWSRDPSEQRAHWNEQMFKITGRPMHLGGPTREEWIEEIVHPDDRAAIRAARLSVPHGQLSVEHECRIVRPDGEVRWLVNRARREQRDGVMMVFGVTLDVTERMRAEAERRRAEAELRSVNERVALAARSVGMGTWEWDVATGEAMWDEAMFHLRGMTPQARALTAEQRLASTHPDDVESVQRELQEAARNTGPTAYEFRVVWPDGTVRWLASRSTPAPDELGRGTRRIGVNWDITDSKDAEVQRREHEVAVRESRAKSEFLSRMSHELRTPLNAVLGFTQLLLLGKDPLQPQQRSKLGHIQSAGGHLLALIDDVLDLSSLESDKLRLDLQPVPLAEVLHEALPLVDALARTHGIAIETGALPGIVRGDRTRLRQMLINLLSNAIKYNKPQGRVSVSSDAGPTTVSLHVTDTGRGMTPDQLAHLFEPFNRLGREREGIEGTGIGLAVVKALASCMSGEVQVTSRAGEGSVFTIVLPAASDGTAGPAPAGTPSAVPAPAPAPRRQGTVLYVEDNPVNVLLVQELLRMRPGLVLASASTGMAGVAQAAALKPDLVLIDIQLPDIDGFDVLRHLQQQEATSHIPCIALSANAMPDDIARARAAGFADYWTKPIDFAAFLAALDGRFPVV